MRRWLHAFVLASACGGDAVTTSGPGQPPPPQSGTPPTSDVLTFAVHDFFLGDMLRGGTTFSTTAWNTFGYNLDGKVTTSTSTDVCTLLSGAPLSNQVDGIDGIDNAFGAVFIAPGPGSDDWPTTSLSETLAIDRGAYGGVPPTFDLTTDWPVLSSSLADGQTIAGGATAAFEHAYVVDGTFVSDKSASVVEVDLHNQGVVTPLMLHDAFFTFHHDGSDALDGVIVGILDTQELVDELAVIAGRISPSLCGAAFDGDKGHAGSPTRTEPVRRLTFAGRHTSRLRRQRRRAHPLERPGAPRRGSSIAAGLGRLVRLALARSMNRRSRVRRLQP